MKLLQITNILQEFCRVSQLFKSDKKTDDKVVTQHDGNVLQTYRFACREQRLFCDRWNPDVCEVPTYSTRTKVMRLGNPALASSYIKTKKVK